MHGLTCPRCSNPLTQHGPGTYVCVRCQHDRSPSQVAAHLSRPAFPERPPQEVSHDEPPDRR